MKTALVGLVVEETAEVEKFEVVRTVSWMQFAAKRGQRLYVSRLTPAEIARREKARQHTDVFEVSLTPKGEKKQLPKNQIKLWLQNRAIIPAD